MIDDSWLSASCFHVRLTRDATANVVARSNERMCFTSSDGSASMDMMSRSDEEGTRALRTEAAGEWELATDFEYRYLEDFSEFLRFEMTSATARRADQQSDTSGVGARGDP